MTGRVLAYGTALALLALLLSSIRYFYFVRHLSTELLILLLALLFTALGLWVGRRIAARPSPVFSSQSVNKRAIACLGLTARELDVLSLMAEGCSNKEISVALYISINTVKSHVSSLLAKLEVERRTQAVRKGQLLGLIESSGRMK